MHGAGGEAEEFFWSRRRNRREKPVESTYLP